MATPRWIGAALDVADVWRIVVGGTWVAGETATITVNGRDLVLTVGATVTTTAIATALKEMWNGDAITGDATRSETGNNVPEFAEATATVSSSTVTITMSTKGKPITITVAETSPSGTLTLTNPTVATGKNWWNNTDNWDTGVVPVSTDTVYIDNSDVSILYGLNQSAVTLTALYIAQSFTGDIGLPEVNGDGEEYHEYRDQYLRIGATTLQIGSGPGNGSGRIKINVGSVATGLLLVNSGTSADELPAVIWKGTNAANTLVQRGGSLGIAVFGAEVATLSTFSVEDGQLLLGAGVTLSGALAVNDGSVEINSLVNTSLTVLAGSVGIDGTANVNQLTVRGGTVVYNTSGTLGGATLVSGGGILDFSQDPRAVSVTNPIDVHGQTAQVLDPNKRISGLIVDLNEGATPAQLDLGLNVRLTRATPA